jgi:hypothetical protein
VYIIKQRQSIIIINDITTPLPLLPPSKSGVNLVDSDVDLVESAVVGLLALLLLLQETIICGSRKDAGFNWCFCLFVCLFVCWDDVNVRMHDYCMLWRWKDPKEISNSMRNNARNVTALPPLYCTTVACLHHDWEILSQKNGKNRETRLTRSRVLNRAKKEMGKKEIAS